MISSIGKYLSAVAQALGGRWFLLPGFISGIIALYGFLQNHVPGLPTMSWWAIFPLALVPIILWVIGGLTKRVVDLEDRNRPRIDLFLEGDGIQSVLVTDLSQSLWVQVSIRPVGNFALQDCEVHVTSMQELGEDVQRKLLEESGRCTWSNELLETRKIDIPNGIIKRANLFARYEKTPQELALQMMPRKVLLDMVTYSPGKYEIGITASAKDSVSVSKMYIFEWGPEFESLSLEEKN